MTTNAESTGMSLPSDETFIDSLRGFSLPDRDARGRVARLDRVLEKILQAHDYPPVIQHLLAEALVLAALIGGLAKDEGSQMTMQAQTEGGAVRLLVCDYREGELRGYVQHDAQGLEGLGANPGLERLFGKGYLAITFDIGSTGQRYQGIVPLEGATLSEACENYFAQSEQVPTLIRVGVRRDGARCVVGGILVQHLPEGEEGRERIHARIDHPQWEHVSILAGSVKHGELVDEALSLEALIWRLFHEEREIRVLDARPLARGCRCSIAHFESVLSRFPSADRADMRNDDGIILVDCAFCSRQFPIQD